MNADVNNQQPCTCELCQPNWHLGRGDHDFDAQPAEAKARQVTLEEVHARKMASNQFANVMAN